MNVLPDQVDAFGRDGVVVFERLLSPSDVDRVLAAMARIYRGEYNADRRPPRVRTRLAPLGNERSVHWMLNSRILDSDLWSVATDARLGRIAATLMRSESASIVEDQLLAKPPGGVPVNIHQDYAYWPFSTSTRMITCWIALVDITLEMGPVEVIRGSQTWGRAPRPSELIVGSNEGFEGSLASVAHPDKLDFVPVVVPAGGGAFFHSLSFHGSRENRSSRWRRAMSLHWASSECRANLAEVRHHDYPYFFARLQNGGPLVNKYMPQVFPSE
jgi:phytanoyl-CoA hydroxylase